jgi:hypothetical protein
MHLEQLDMKRKVIQLNFVDMPKKKPVDLMLKSKQRIRLPPS